MDDLPTTPSAIFEAWAALNAVRAAMVEGTANGADYCTELASAAVAAADLEIRLNRLAAIPGSFQ
jgi:hypothetical protein